MMKKYLLIVLLLVSTLGIARSVSAHQSQIIQIGNKQYIFMVGFLNEPAYVNDKSGVDLIVKLADPKNPNNLSSPAVKPVAGLESTLKVEISAGDKTQTLDLKPAYKDPGVYHAIFFPTVATTYGFAFKGSIDGTNVTIPFQCGATQDGTKGDTQLSEGVVRKMQSGAFGCPLALEPVQFPVASTTDGMNEDTTHSIVVTLSLVSFVFSLIAFMKVRKLSGK